MVSIEPGNREGPPVNEVGRTGSPHGSQASLQHATRQASPFCGGLRHGIDRGDAFPSSTIYDGAFTSSAEADAQSGLGQR